MKINKLIIVSISIFLLSACSPKDIVINNNQDNLVAPTTDVKVSQSIQNTITDLGKKYRNPKRATLRFVDTKEKKVAGKVYLQYDKSDKFTYFWLKTDANTLLDSKTVYQVSLIASKKDVVKLGNLQFDIHGNGYVYFKFPKQGNFYKYLQVKVKQDGKEILHAYFNRKLS